MQFTNNRNTEGETPDKSLPKADLIPGANEPANSAQNLARVQIQADSDACPRNSPIESDDKKAELYNKLGEVLWESQKWLEAVNAYEDGMKLYPEFPFSYDKLAESLLELQRWDEAVNSYRKAIEVKPNFTWSYFKLGEALMKLERWDEAVRVYQKAIALNPDFPWSYFQLGEALIQLSRWEKAVAVYCRFINLKPDFIAAYHHLSRVWKEFKQGQIEAVNLERVIKFFPNSHQCYKLFGNAFKKIGLVEEAIACYQKGIEIDKDDHELQTSLGEAFLQKGEFEGAISCFIKAIQLQPDYLKAYHKLRGIHKFGQAKVQQSQLEDLVKIYRKAIEIKPDFLEHYVNLGDVLTQQNRIDEAVSCYQAVVCKKTQASHPDFVERHWDFQKSGRPNFIIIGTVKGGTTSLYNYICQHPHVLPATEKEVLFFQEQFKKGKDWYFAHFPQIPPGEKFLTGEATPTYMYGAKVGKRIFKTIPNVKLIVILRNPVNRAVSHYKMLEKFGQNQTSLEEALTGEMKVLNRVIKQDIEEVNFRNKKSSLRCGLYVYFLQKWMNIFPREQLLILKSEDLYDNPGDTMREVFNFLGLSNYQNSEYKNYLEGNYSDINEDMRSRLSEFFQPHNRKLEAFLGRRFNWEY